MDPVGLAGTLSSIKVPADPFVAHEQFSQDTHEPQTKSLPAMSTGEINNAWGT